ncbi:MAG: hypothetical protein ACFFD1_00860 [Candidatus Thorarchaeota archaeon]
MRKAIGKSDIEHVLSNFHKFLEEFERLRQVYPGVSKLDMTQKVMLFDVMMKG